MAKSGKPARSGQQAYWILDKQQIACLTSVPRVEILDWLASAGPQSVSELAASLDRQPSSLYHHLQKMLDVGLVEAAGSQTVYRRTEKLYKTPSRRMRLKRALSDGDHDPLMARSVTAMCNQFQRDFASGLANPRAKRSGQYRDLGFYRFVGRPSADGLKEVNKHLDAIAEILWADQDQARPEVSLGWIMAPPKREN